MTRGETIFCLRNVHRYWSAPRLLYHEVQQLVRLNLIEQTITGTPAIRLTAEGARVKNWGPVKALRGFTGPISALNKTDDAKKSLNKPGLWTPDARRWSNAGMVMFKWFVAIRARISVAIVSKLFMAMRTL